MQILLSLIAIILFALPSFAATLEVGSGQTYSTIAAAIAASSDGDTINVHAGEYAENPNVSKDITLQRNGADNVQITGQVRISHAGATLDGFYIAGWSGATHGVTVDASIDGVTIKNNSINGGGVVTGSASGIYIRNSYQMLIDNNTIYGCQKGINANSGHSLDNTYENGVVISNNKIYNNPTDGIDIHGEYFTVSGNLVDNNIDTNWGANHPDGIQFIRSDVDGYSNVNHARVYNNRFTNHTQGIFLEGWSADDPVSDVDIWNNIIYNSEATVNGVDMTALSGVHVKVKGAQYVRIYNNYFGYMKGAGQIIVSPQGTPVTLPETIIIKNNIFANTNTVANYYGISCDKAGHLATADVDYNIYNMGNGYLAYIAPTGYTNFATLQAAGYEAHGMSGNPDVAALPSPIPPAASIAVDNGAIAGVLYASDILGVARPQGAAWDIGPYEYNTGAGDTTPSAFSFTDQTGVALGSTNNSDNVTLAGFDNTTTLVLTGDASCKYSINGAAWATANDNINVNDNVALQNVASGSYSTAIGCTLTVGGVANTGAPWTRATLAAVESPTAPRMKCGSMAGGWK